MSKEYKYSKMISGFYDVVYDKILDKSGLNFYLGEILKAKGSVLEIGCGTGRIFVPALKRGADIYGIDISENMIEILKKKIPEEEFERITLCSVSELSMKRKFSLIVAPFRMFSHLITVKEQLTALKNIYRHLAKDGKFIFDVFVPDYKLMQNEKRTVMDFEGEYAPGKKLKRFAILNYRNIEQIVDITFRFEYDENGNVKSGESSFPFRYFFRYELEHLLYRSGFEDVEIFGDFKRNGLNIGSRDFVVNAYKNKPTLKNKSIK